MSSAHWHLTYPQELVAEPVLWRLAVEHGLQTNVRRANVEDTLGWAIVEVRGTENQISAGRRWLAGLGVEVSDL